MAHSRDTALPALDRMVRELRACERCPRMHKPVVSGGPVVSRVLLVGQAPGVKEPVLGRPFAWTAGKTLFRWFAESCGVDEPAFRQRVYMAAVCRCFPGKTKAGGDRVPDTDEIANCAHWLGREMTILRPELVIPVGRLAISQFVEFDKMTGVIGQKLRAEFHGHEFDLIPLPHPSGASPWHRVEPGKSLLRRALALVAGHPAFAAVRAA
jgi:uracil-DNA glycosylase